jgi:hypothetical protein
MKVLPAELAGADVSPWIKGVQWSTKGLCTCGRDTCLSQSRICDF